MPGFGHQFAHDPVASSGGTIVGLSPPEVILKRAQALLGSTADSISFSDFDDDQWYTAALTGTGSAALSNTDRSGVLILDSGASANSRAAIGAHGATPAALALVANQRTDKWYVRGRLQIPTAVDAQTSCGIWLSLHDFTNPYVFFGVLGTVSTAAFMAQLVNDVGTTNNIVTLVAIDTLWHLFEMWNDGVSFWIAIDGNVVGFQPPSTLLGTGKGTPYAWAANNTTAASRQLKLDKLAYCFASQ